MTIDLFVIIALSVFAVVNPWSPVSEIRDKARRRRLKLSE